MDPEKVIELVIEFEDEVNNGGLHQYFNNSSGNHATETISALEAIDAFTLANVLRRAVSMFPEGGAPKDREMRQNVLWLNFPGATDFNELDKEFFAYPDDLSKLMANFKATVNQPWP